MIKITIELWPSGFEHGKKLLGTVEIANDGKGTVTRGNYQATFFTRKGMRFKRIKILDHPRKAQSIWRLLGKIFTVFT